MKAVWLIALGGIVLASVAFAWRLYVPDRVITHYSDKIPEKWQSVCALGSRRAIYQHLGQPDEDLRVKGSQNYVTRRWYGVELLKLIGEARDLDAPPYAVYHSVVVTGPLFMNIGRVGRGYRMCEGKAA